MRRIKVVLKDVKSLVVEIEDDDATELTIAGLTADTIQASGDIPPFGFTITPTGAPDEDGEEE